MKIAVRKLKNNIDLNSLTTSYDTNNFEEEPKSESVIELPKIEEVQEEENQEEFTNIPVEEPYEEKLPEKYIDNTPNKIEESKPGFLGTPSPTKKFTLSGFKEGNYGKVIYFGLGLTLLAQFISN